MTDFGSIAEFLGWYVMSNLKRATNLKTSILPDGYIAIFSAPTERAYTLPPLGALAWEFFDGEHSNDDVVAQVAKLIDSETTPLLRQQILELIDELRQNGFLKE